MTSTAAPETRAASFDVTIEAWDGHRYATRLEGGDAILAWPGKRVVVTPRSARGMRITPLFRARRTGRGIVLRASGATRPLPFRIEATKARPALDTWLLLMLPETVPVKIVPVAARGIVASGELAGYPLGIYPESVPERFRDRAKALSSRFYIVTDSSLRIAPGFFLRDFISKIRPDRTWTGRAHPLALDYGLVNTLERIEAAWRATGYPGRVRIESPFRTPDYNNADEAGRATFSQHMYGSACDIIFSADDDHLQDDIDRDGDRDLGDLLPLARIVERLMRAGKIPRGGIGVYHYIHRDGRPEEFTIHVDIRGRMVKWGSVYDSDTVKPTAEIAW